MTRRRPLEFRTDVRADHSDARDVLAAPPDGALPALVDPAEYRRYVHETWHQRGLECTGFALAAVANHAIRRQLDDPHEPSVSRRMLYEMAQVHDGRDYVQGSTLRGALKGWRMLGVASEAVWPYHPDDEDGSVHGHLTLARVLDARHRPLLQYRRIERAAIDGVKHALASGHAVFACADVHVGWYRLFADGEHVIDRQPDDESKGGHAFVICGYGDDGFWLHNSWGPHWGDRGYAVLPFDQWAATASSAWVVDTLTDRSEPPVDVERSPIVESELADEGYRDLWRHLLVVGDDGRLVDHGRYEMDGPSVGTLLYLFQLHTESWARRRVAIVVDDGARSPELTVERLRAWCDEMLEAQIYPLFVVWETAWLDALRDDLARWQQRLRTGGDAREADGPPTDVDDTVIERAAVLESVARRLWSELDDRAALATRPPWPDHPHDDGGAGVVLARAIAYKRGQYPFDLHVVSLGSGDRLALRLAEILPAPVSSIVTLAPPSPLDQFRTQALALLDGGRVGRLELRALADDEIDGAGPGSPAAALVARLVAEVVGLDHETAAKALVRGPDGWKWDAERIPVAGRRRDVEADEELSLRLATGRVVLEPTPTASEIELPLPPSMRRRIVERLLDVTGPPAGGAALGHHPTTDPATQDAPAVRDPLERARARLRRARR